MERSVGSSVDQGMLPVDGRHSARGPAAGHSPIDLDVYCRDLWSRPADVGRYWHHQLAQWVTP
jgi:hypothetical protein